MDVIPEREARISRLSFTYLMISCFYIKSLYGLVIINEASSSPSSITALKGSPVQLHWSYTLDPAVVPTFFTFKKQTCSVNDTLRYMVTVVAEKTTYSGQLTVKSGLPSSLNGRISVIGSNNTLLIKNVNYNDTFSQFYSTAIMTVVSSGAESPEALKPIVQVTVEGSPAFVAALPKNFEVVQNGELKIITDFDGNPEPTAEVEFPHSSTKSAMTITKLYPFIYRATYTFKRVPASYCGRTVITRVKNKIGTITGTSTINVKLTLDDPNLRARKLSETCVEVEWQKKESGACRVTYQVNYKTANNTIQFTDTVVNKRSTIRCCIPSSINITSVELKMNSTSTNTASYSTSVLQAPGPTVVPIITSTTPAGSIKETADDRGLKTEAHVGYGLTIVILVFVVAVLISIILRSRKKKHEEKVVQFSHVERNSNLEETASKESNYSELHPNNREYEHIYTGLTKSKENKSNEEKVQYSNISVKY